jgi:hypothetical protein
MTGGWPFGAHVLRTAGLRQAPASSSKTSHPPHSEAPFYERPGFALPGIDSQLVTLFRLPSRSLRRPIEPAQHFPDRARVVMNARLTLNHVRHPRERPELSRVPTRARSARERGHDQFHLRTVESSGRTRRPGRSQRAHAALLPRVIPVRRSLVANAKLARYARSRPSLLEQLRRSQATLLLTSVVAPTNATQPRRLLICGFRGHDPTVRPAHGHSDSVAKPQ